MCFSVEASFGASLFLGIVSVIGYRKIATAEDQNKKLLALLLVPLGFAIQQFGEGLVWLSLIYNYGFYFKTFATYLFMFFAFIFWPAYIPLGLYYLEPNSTYKKILKKLSVVGVATSVVLFMSMVYFGINAQIKNCHVLYELNLLDFKFTFSTVVMITYLIATVVSLLVSSLKNMRVVGLLMGATYIVTYIFYREFLISIWCFFAAVVSLLIYWVISSNLNLIKDS